MGTKCLKYFFMLSPLAAIIWFSSTREHPDHDFSYTLFQSGSGWGYNILLNTHVVIHQENIPAIQTQKGFENKGEAKRAASLVIKKILFHEPPGLNKSEIQEILSGKDPLAK